jgi:hypothetical protein
MPNINHKRKTSKKSKSSKRSKNAIRNKKTRSNIRKMRGGAKVGDLVYSKITGLLLGKIIKKKDRVYIIKPKIKKNINYVIKASEELDWSTIEPDPETVSKTKEKQKNIAKAKIGDYVYDISNRIIGRIIEEKKDYFSIDPYEQNFGIGYIAFDKSNEGLYWYSSPDKVNKNNISKYQMRLDDAKVRVDDAIKAREEKLKHRKDNAPTSIRRSGINLESLTDNMGDIDIDVDDESSIEVSESQFDSHA